MSAPLDLVAGIGLLGLKDGEAEREPRVLDGGLWATGLGAGGDRAAGGRNVCWTTWRSPTDLVAEAFLRLAADPHAVRDRVHFFATAARAMRQILVDHARRRAAR